MEFKKTLSDYSEFEFKNFVQEMKDDIGTVTYQDELMFHFDSLVGELGGTDLIFYPELGADTSAQGVTEIVKKWCEANGLPGFKPRF